MLTRSAVGGGRWRFGAAARGAQVQARDEVRQGAVPAPGARSLQRPRLPEVHLVRRQEGLRRGQAHSLRAPVNGGCVSACALPHAHALTRPSPGVLKLTAPTTHPDRCVGTCLTLGQTDANFGPEVPRPSHLLHRRHVCTQGARGGGRPEVPGCDEVQDRRDRHQEGDAHR